MARQSVTSAIYPYLPVSFVINSHQYSALALVDTGFTGELAIPAGLPVEDLGDPETPIDWELADGSTVEAPLYPGTLVIGQFPPFSAAITVLGNSYMLRRGAIDRYEVTFDHGQRVILTP